MNLEHRSTRIKRSYADARTVRSIPQPVEVSQSTMDSSGKCWPIKAAIGFIWLFECFSGEMNWPMLSESLKARRCTVGLNSRWSAVTRRVVCVRISVMFSDFHWRFLHRRRVEVWSFVPLIVCVLKPREILAFSRWMAHGIRMIRLQQTGGGMTV